MKNIRPVIKFNSLSLYFLLIAVLCGYMKRALIILFIVLFHELGHILFCLLFHYKVKEVEIFPFGGVTKMEKLLNTPIEQELLIASGGILFQSILTFLGAFGVIIDQELLFYNKSILLFNLLPIIPLDGSKIMFEILNLFMPYKKALSIYPFCSLFFIVIYFLLNYKSALNNYLLIILFLYKTFEIFKNKEVFFHKFILERMLYKLKFHKVKNQNQELKNYYKSTKYFYNVNHQIMDEQSYLNRFYKD